MSVSCVALPALFGLAFGSFVALVAVRLPVREPIASGRSRCRSCGVTLGALSMVPVLSWLVQRGRCAACGDRIAVLYPVVELTACLLPLWAATMLSGWLLWATSALGWVLLLLATIDARVMMLPDVLTLPLIVAGLAVFAAVDPAALPQHVAGAAGGFLALALVAWVYRRTRGRSGLGLGDAKLLAAAGAWTGWQGLASIVLYASATALAVTVAVGFLGRRVDPARPLAFGPYLCLAFWLVWLYGPLAIS